MAPTEADRERTIRDLYERAYDAGDYDVLEDIFADEVRFADDVLADGTAAAFFADSLAQVRGAFPDFAVTVHGVAVDGRVVVANTSWSGTHEDDLVFGEDELRFPPTGETVSVGTLSWYEFEDDVVVAVDSFSDEWSMFRDLGVAGRLVEFLDGASDSDGS